MRDDLLSPLSPVTPVPPDLEATVPAVPADRADSEIEGITKDGHPVTLAQLDRTRGHGGSAGSAHPPRTPARWVRGGAPPAAGRRRIPLVREILITSAEIDLSCIEKRTQPITKKGILFQNDEICRIADFLVVIAANYPELAGKCEKLTKFALTLVK